MAFMRMRSPSRAPPLLRRDGSQILLGADRPMIDPFYGKAAEAIDCTKATTQIDIAICSNPDALKADAAMGDAYTAALNRSSRSIGLSL